MNKKIGFFNMTALWFGAAISLSEMMTGGLLTDAGFKKAVMGILIGHAIGAAILAAGAYIGASSKLAAMESTSRSFGKLGTKLFASLNVIQLIGWTTIMIIVGARAFGDVSNGYFGIQTNLVWVFVIGALVFFWIFMGMNGMKYINTGAVILLFFMTLVMTIQIFTGKSDIINDGGKGMSLGSIIELNVLMPLSWLPLAGDYTRFGTSRKSSTLGCFLGYFIGSSWMYIAGVASSLVTGDSDPTKIFTTMHFGIVALLIILLSTITTTFMDAYSAGVSIINVSDKIDEKSAALFITVAATLMALFFPMEQYENFLYFIGSVFAPLFSIVFADYFIFKKYSSEDNKIFKIDLLAIVFWVLGVILYYEIKDMDIFLGVTVPVMLVTAAVYSLFRVILKRKF